MITVFDYMSFAVLAQLVFCDIVVPLFVIGPITIKHVQIINAILPNLIVNLYFHLQEGVVLNSVDFYNRPGLGCQLNNMMFLFVVYGCDGYMLHLYVCYRYAS